MSKIYSTSVAIICLFGLCIHCLVIPKAVKLFQLSKKLTPYRSAWQWQNALVDYQVRQQLTTKSDHLIPTVGSLLVLQHKSVYTLGTGTQSNSGPFGMTSRDGAPLEYETIEVDRAGQATYHGPGQIVLYPILDLSQFEKDIHQYLRRLERVVIEALKSFGIIASRIEGATGVWVTATIKSSHTDNSCVQPASHLPSKVAAIGIKLRSSWVTMHGVSVNVRPDMRYFDNIVPCGISDRAVGSLSHFVPGVTTEEVATELVRRFGEVFEVQLEKEGDGGEDEAERYLNSLPVDVVT